MKLAPKADATLTDAVADDVLDTRERARDNKQHVGGVELHVVLLRMLPPALRRHGRDRPFEDLE